MGASLFFPSRLLPSLFSTPKAERETQKRIIPRAMTAGEGGGGVAPVRFRACQLRSPRASPNKKKGEKERKRGGRGNALPVNTGKRDCRLSRLSGILFVFTPAFLWVPHIPKWIPDWTRTACESVFYNIIRVGGRGNILICNIKYILFSCRKFICRKLAQQKIDLFIL